MIIAWYDEFPIIDDNRKAKHLAGKKEEIIMKKRTIAFLLAVVMVAGVLSGCGDKEQNATTPVADTDQKVEEQATEAPATEEPVSDDTTDEVSEPETEEEADTDTVPSIEECRTLCDELDAGEPVMESKKVKKDLKRLCDIALGRYAGENEEIYFPGATGDDLYMLEYITLSSAWYDIIKHDENNMADKEEVLDFWYNLYGRDKSMPIEDEYIREEDGKITAEFGDGENGYYFGKDVYIYENDEYYLLSGVMQAEYEGDDIIREVLIRKNAWELPGTVVYMREI